MFHRFALMVAAVALGASSVAPAQVGPTSQIATVTPNDVPAPAAEPLVALPQNNDPLVQTAPSVEPDQPTDDADQTDPQPVRGRNLAESVALLRAADPGSRELECLAAGVYFESKGEPLAGQLAVGQVIANRANSRGRFPSTYCGVLMQRGQFSFIRGGRWPAVSRSSSHWRTAVAIARIVDRDLHDSSVSNALFFHAKRVAPRWRLTRVGSVGNHVFYR